MGQVLAKTKENIYWLRFVKPGQTMFTTSIFDLVDKNVIDIGRLNCLFYDGWKDNDHHIMTKCYYKNILPFISMYINSFPFNIKDFRHINYFTQEEKYDVSYLVPNDDSLKFSCEVNGVEVVKNGNFCDLIYLNNKNYKKDLNFTDYHKLFIGSHQCSILKNETIDTDKTMFITGDSMMIPCIPIFGCYYKEVVFMDNRTDESFKHYFEGKVFDEVIIQLWEGHPITKPLGINLK